MNITKIKEINRTYKIVVFLITLFVTYIMFALTKHGSFWGDDYFFSLYWYNEDIFGCLIDKEFVSRHGGGYIGLFLTKFFSFGLPNLLGFHPSNYVGGAHAIIKGIITIITLLAISKFSYFGTKSKMVNVSIFSFLAFFFYYDILVSFTCVPYISYNFYRYFFSLFFLSIFYIFMFKNILKKQEKIHWKDLIIASLCAYVVGTSIEISFFMSLTVAFLVVLYNIALSVIQLISKNKDKWKSLKFNLDLNFYLPNVFLMLAVGIFVSSYGFKEVATDRGLGDFSLTLETVREFSVEYMKYCIQNELAYWIICLILFVVVTIIAKKRNEMKLIFILAIYYISLLTVMFSLVLCNKTCHMSEPFTHLTYFVSHVNILFLYKFLLIIPFIIMFSYVVKGIKKAGRNVLVGICLFSTIVLAIYLGFQYKEKYNNEEFLKSRKREVYMAEKLLRFYYLRKELPVVHMEIEDWFYQEDERIYNNHTPTTVYYSKVYKDETVNEIGYKREPDAFEKFYNAGGFFTEEELYNLDFARLYDEEFVLREKPSQDDLVLSVEEVKARIPE